MALSVRTRFEVFKRDDFACKYCGRRSPEAILEVDHIVPIRDGGSDDPMNLTTSCWDCNSGKSCVPLGTVMTGEDPHDRAVALIERKRQLEEYNFVLAADRERRERETWELWAYWQTERGIPDRARDIPRRDFGWIMKTLTYCPRVIVQEFMDSALEVGANRDLRYVKGCVKNWRGQAPQTPPPVAAASEPDLDDFEASTRAYIRLTALDEVFEAVMKAEFHRRSIGRCTHEPQCDGHVPCVLRQARIWITN